MRSAQGLTRRSVLLGGAGAALAAVPMASGHLLAQDATPQATPAPMARTPLWQPAWENGIVYGPSATTWQLDAAAYAALVAHEAALLFTEDDLHWWRL